MMKPLRVLIASGAFKDVYSPVEACEVIKKVLCNIECSRGPIQSVCVPMVDGGEYSADVLEKFLKCERITVDDVIDPRGKPVKSHYLKVDDVTAYIASSSIVRLTPDQEVDKNPLNLTSFGLGQLIQDAIDNSFKKIIIGLGGTSTVDGGIGMLQALGVEFVGENGSLMKPQRGDFFTGADVSRITDIQAEEINGRFDGIDIQALCDGCIPLNEIDVPTNQKISSLYDDKRADILNTLLDSLKHFSGVVARNLERRDRKKWLAPGPFETQPFFGVAGAMLFGLILAFDVHAQQGVDFFIDIFHLDDAMRQTDIVITGEGKIDNSLKGKTPIGVSRLAKGHNKPVVFLCGHVDESLAQDFVSALMIDAPDGYKDNGIDVIISCHGRFASGAIPGDYAQRVKFYRERSPQIFQEGLEIYFKQKEGCS